MNAAFDILVAGTGPAGLAAAALSARSGAKTICLTGPDTSSDPRTVAIMQPGLRLLQALELWPGDLQTQSAPLKKLRLVDDTGGILAAPELTFDARETQEDAFGWNVPLKAMCPALRMKCEALPLDLKSRAISPLFRALAESRYPRAWCSRRMVGRRFCVRR